MCTRQPWGYTFAGLGLSYNNLLPSSKTKNLFGVRKATSYEEEKGSKNSHRPDRLYERGIHNSTGINVRVNRLNAIDIRHVVYSLSAAVSVFNIYRGFCCTSFSGSRERSISLAVVLF